MRCLITKYDIEKYKYELKTNTSSLGDVREALNTISFNMHRITKADARMMLNLIVKETKKCVA